MITVKKYQMVRTESPDGEIHLILTELKLDDDSNNRNVLDEIQIKKIMKDEAQKPLHLLREYE